MPSIRPALLVLVLPLFLASCAMEGIYVRVMRPAPVHLGQYPLVAIDRFQGPGCDQVAVDFTAALRRTTNPMTGKQDFEVIDRGEVDRMLDDMRGRQGKDWDERTMEVLERWRSAKLVLRGEVTQNQASERMIETPFTDDGKTQRMRRTRQVTAVVEVRIEATDTEGDHLFDKAVMRGVAQAQTVAIDGMPKRIDPTPLVEAARAKVVQQYLDRILPHEVTVRVNLYTDGDLPELQVGNGFAKTGNWDSALRKYEEAVARAQGDLRYKALFNLGVALEHCNRFDEARQSLEEAYSLEQDSTILAELQSVSRREGEYQALMEQAAQPAR
ncbi:MAG: tetratricopeptide repeat protein [Planctomycetota bacterium]